jgi:2-amino-4-hydroxy-6-hydroxymethyldihydropteridine diphosphokinase
MPSTAYLSLGSNLGNREQSLRQAIARLTEAGTVVQQSSIYETEPVEFTAQPWFLNCVVELETDLTPQRLMAELLAIEQEMGRERTQKKGPRVIDLDILLFGDLVTSSADLTIPHPAMQERRFVLEPLVEIAPQVTHPRLKKTAKELLERLPSGQSVRQIAR